MAFEKDKVGQELGVYYAKAARKALQFNTTGFSKETIRQMTSFKSVGLGHEDDKELGRILNEMTQIYGSFQVNISIPTIWT